MPIISKMDARENNFLIVLQDEVPHAGKHTGERQAAAFPSSERHDAITAKRIATVLNFEKSAGTPRMH